MPDFALAAGRARDVLRLGRLQAVAGWSLAGAALVLLACVLAGQKLLADPDTQWHIAIGRWIFEHSAFPATDPLSFTFEGAPWIAKEWLSQLLLAGVYETGGWRAVVFLTAGAVALAVWMIMAEGARRRTPLSGLIAGLLAFMAVAPTAVARPHVLVFPVVTAWTIALLRSMQTTRRPPWLALILLALWANMHAGFTMGFIIAAAFGLEALIRSEPSERVKLGLLWAVFGAGCLIAGIATPYGMEPLLLNLKLASGNEAMAFIGEWKPLGLKPHAIFVVLVAVACLIALARVAREQAARLLLVAFLAYTMIRHERFVMVFGLVAPLVAGGALTLLCADLAKRFGLFQDGALLPAGWKPALVATIAGVIALTVALTRPTLPPPTVAPFDALAAVPVELRHERVFNSYDLGGFLALRGVETFIDGRTDQLFLDGFITSMMTAAAAAEPTQLAAILDRYRVQWAIIGAHKPEARLFPKLSGWQPLYRDGDAHVYVRAPAGH